VDRLVVRPDMASRLTDSIETALATPKGSWAYNLSMASNSCLASASRALIAARVVQN
jgi:hypothetical protein